MNQNKIIQPNFQSLQDFLDKIVAQFDYLGENFGDQDRNALKIFKLDALTLNVKSFKIPNVTNQVAYRFFRKSKAQRSYVYANRLKALGIGTPQPIAYYEFTGFFLFKKSFYISEQQACDLTFRELTINQNYPDHETILRAFTRFTYQLHEKGILFLDHSPGNTLIKKNDNGYEFFLVDLNRMEFGIIPFEKRINNFSRLTIHKEMVAVMSDEYAKCSGKDYQEIYNLMWQATEQFQSRFHQKIRLKKRLKFWKRQ